jgi:uncharacterized protein (TIGR03083 family)
VERRATGPVPHDQTDDLQVPEGAEQRSHWLRAGARRLADAVREAGPTTGVWSWAEDQSAGFRLRRITHDTLVHRLDAELAVGRAVAVAPDLAADSVSDLLDLFRVLPRIDDFPLSPGCAAKARRCSSTRPTRVWARPATGWPGAPRPASSGSTSTTRATSSSAARFWTCCWC